MNTPTFVTRTKARPRINSSLARLLASSGLLLISAWAVGCSSDHTTSVKSIEVENPRATGGAYVVEEADPGTEDGLARIAAALDDLAEPNITPGMLESIRARAEHDAMESQREELSSKRANRMAEDEAQPPATTVHVPDNAGRLITLERMSLSELNELMGSIALRLQAEKGFQIALPTIEAQLGARPQTVSDGPALVQTSEDGSRTVLRLGFVSYVSQLPQLWIQGVTIKTDGSTIASSQIEEIEGMVGGSLEQLETMRTGLTQKDLARELVQLSYVDTQSAIKSLTGLGIKTINSVETLPATINYDELPIVTVMPTPDTKAMGLVGSAESASGAFGQSSTPTKASDLNANVLMGQTSELMIVYHPAHPEQYSMVRQLLNKYIDRPARQVFVEGLVLEISEEGLDELGVEWSYQQGSVDFVLGSLSPTGLTDTLGLTNIEDRTLVKNWAVELRALVQDGKAEVLSRPSVITLDNRQATIRVGEDIPIATSQEGFSSASNKVAFNFKYLATGILLNIRPRITESGEEVSMLIDTVVSAQVPGRDLEIRSTAGDLLASAPTVSTRRVQTYARIDNKTPLIIGGLVSRDMSISQDKVPFLGDLPIIGNAFRSKQTSTEKREVIIVLTPYVLQDDDVVSRILPKDDDLFDSTGNKLFRDAFRIRSQDVFDLRFLAENKRLRIYRDLARELMKNNFTFKEIEPFSQFADDTIPGEEILVHRMIYELIKRTEVDERVNPQRIIYFEEKDYEGYNVRFLDSMLAKLGDGQTPESFFKLNPGKAIAITYTYKRNSLARQDLASEPIPEVALVDCPNRDAWQQLLWDMNQPNNDGINRYTIIIQGGQDIMRLQRAIMLKKIVQLNGGEESLSLDNFSIGKILHTPELGSDAVTVIDADVARYFFHTELYYAAIIKRIEETLKQFDEAIDDPSVQMYLEPGANRADLE
ncbi:MAG: type II secretion system protein GspD [Phycisphaerales bacterium JB052]